MLGNAVRIPVGMETLDGDLAIPPDACGIVLFAHGSGSSRKSTRNRAVAATLRKQGLATLLMDLLTQDEENQERLTAHLRFDIVMLTARLCAATRYVMTQQQTAGLPIGYFGASTGAAAALSAAAEAAPVVKAVVSRGGRPDLAGGALAVVTAPTLLIVGAADRRVLELNRTAQAKMHSATTRLEIVPRAGHLFAEHGTLDQVADLAADWFSTHLPAA